MDVKDFGAVGDGIADDTAAIQSAIDRACSRPSRLSRLSPSERRVAEAVARGLTNRQIGAELGVADQTVKNHLTSTFTKLGVTSRTQLVILLLGDRR